MRVGPEEIGNVAFPLADFIKNRPNFPVGSLLDGVEDRVIAGDTSDCV